MAAALLTDRVLTEARAISPTSTLHGVTLDLTELDGVWKIRGDAVKETNITNLIAEELSGHRRVEPIEGRYLLDGEKIFLITAYQEQNFEEQVMSALSEKGIDDVWVRSYQRSEHARHFVEAYAVDGGFICGTRGRLLTIVRTHIPITVEKGWHHAAAFFATDELPHAGNIGTESYSRLFLDEGEMQLALAEAVITDRKTRIQNPERVTITGGQEIVAVPFSLRPEAYIWVGPKDKYVTGKCESDPSYMRVSLDNARSIQGLNGLLDERGIDKVCMVAYSNIEIKNMGSRVAYMIDESTVPGVRTHVTAP